MDVQRRRAPTNHRRHDHPRPRRRHPGRPSLPRRRVVPLAAIIALVGLVTAGYSTVSSNTPGGDLAARAEQLLLEAHERARQSPGEFGYSTASVSAPLESSAQLADFARSWSTQMAEAGELGHSGSLDELAGSFGKVAENVGYSRVSGVEASEALDANVERIMQSWMDSEGHRENLTSGSFSAVGIGVAVGDDGSLWATAVFGAEAPGSPSASSAEVTQTSGDEATDAPEVEIPDVQSIDELCGSDTPETSEEFDDVAGVVTRAVDCLADLGIATGTAPGEFSPGRYVSRGQMALFVTRALDEAGDELPEGDGDEFPDVDADATAGTAISRLAEAGIVTGRADGTFGPDEPVTRGQMISFLVAADAHLRGEARPEPSRSWFADVPDGSTFAEAIGQAADLGVATGHADGSFAPDTPVRRSQVAQFITRWLAALGE